MSEDEREERARALIGAESMTFLDAVDAELIDQLEILAVQAAAVTDMLLERGIARIAVVGAVAAAAANHAAFAAYGPRS